MVQSSTAQVSRRDAQHNRARILEVASQAFGADGIDVSMDAIAKLAGVGPGTLYRHFPNKDSLLAALLTLHYERLDRRRLEIEAQACDAGRTLELWIEALGDWMQAYDGLPEPLKAACQVDSPLTPACRDVIDTTEILLKVAQDKGFARRTMTGRDIFLGALAIAWAGGAKAAAENTPDVLRGVLRDGWREPKAGGSVPR
ncbi:TetR/AcrR family transcriptional regulator [Variovorax arabinosiphilus]|uniref:TetR/AcrR family transcriptional regulator n=1 Tax=Variovorax arabinosiphilus TaxID=3053498 RepID=UPI0025749D61|nr:MULTISPECIES: TetR/AcrR family transcriptional regulator [unclassified Variovorax]MDM0122603.1 helix-turn-helix domain-containing protein [Variovorax sp. J2L1-78]MDM0130868.1 helix-turn-helix domain-containing protein [Variovorax sp. J2L1-63]MDM0235366.1 helix-turn-helix domain-containing protein [Variovorax sp. J2R1-6]